MKTTKEKILETSLNLFNEKGCINTSTRHIASELNISVGNLYYYFKNKEVILIEIFLQYIENIFSQIEKQNFQKDEIFLLKDFLINCLEADTKYRFLHQELNLLMITFPKFKEVMQIELKKEIELISKLVQHQIKFGYIKKMSEDKILFFVSNSWIIATNSYSFWDLLNKDKSDNGKKGTANLYYFIKPYLTQKSLDDEQIKEIEIVLGSK
ncbi:TetR/AcrR family transcriptional regulator [Halarcobacter sp.]|uniref:TetR/AcrR family transcriptional regulator n=1 Tax=Halarcobacter sp. TaxID=2321133 RepID=UPI002AAB9964|nr:TetR/AcrR family transcriptional regulator [Halarcobacter sp.]